MIGVSEYRKLRFVVIKICKNKWIDDFAVLISVYYGTAITQAKGHEPTLYKTLGVIVGLFLKFAFVKMKWPNK